MVTMANTCMYKWFTSANAEDGGPGGWGVGVKVVAK